jgi:hypothetical protein
MLVPTRRSMTLDTEKALDLAGYLATAGVIATGYLLGGHAGEQLLIPAGINLTSTIIHNASRRVKESWVISGKGVLNHDIQQALIRATERALEQIQREYLAQGKKRALPESADSIKAFFRELKGYVSRFDVHSLGKLIKEKDIKGLLLESQEKGLEEIWRLFKCDQYIHSYHQEFKDFFRSRLFAEVQSAFLEELKTDNAECTRAWRSFQLLLCEGLLEEVRGCKSSQKEIIEALKGLERMEKAIHDLADAVSARQSDEPFQRGLDEALDAVKKQLERISEGTKRIEQTVDRIELKMDGVCKRLSTIPEPPVNPVIPTLADKPLIKLIPLDELEEELLSMGALSRIWPYVEVHKEEIPIAQAKGSDVLIVGHGSVGKTRYALHLIQQKYGRHSYETAVAIPNLLAMTVSDPASIVCDKARLGGRVPTHVVLLIDNLDRYAASYEEPDKEGEKRRQMIRRGGGQPDVNR